MAIPWPAPASCRPASPRPCCRRWSAASSPPARPNNLTLFAAAGQGDGKTLGLNHLGHEGLLRRVVAGHWGRMPKVAQLALDNRIQAYNLPQGIICQLFRDLAAGKPGSFSKVGLHTFVDPRYGGSRINAATTRDIVSLVEVDEEEWLFYKVGEVNVAFIRGTTADTFGNITMEREALTLNNLAMAMAAKNSNGIVIAQVERIAERSGLPPRQVKIPGILVDCVVIAEPAQHMQTLATQYNAAYAGEFRVPAASVVSTPTHRAQDHRPSCGLRTAAERNHQPGRRHARRSRGGRQRGAHLAPADADRGIGPDRRHPLERGQLRDRCQHGCGDRREPAVRLLRRWRPRHGLSRHGRVRRRWQRQRQPLWRPPDRRRRLHQHQPERPPGGLRRHLHRQGSRSRGQGRQTAHRSGGPSSESSSSRSSRSPSMASTPTIVASRSTTSPNAASSGGCGAAWR
jgi:acyl CoA:acetate/3-ketoacid CoA transferase alpha subunit